MRGVGLEVASNYAFLMLGGAKLSSRHTITANPQASNGVGVCVKIPIPLWRSRYQTSEFPPTSEFSTKLPAHIWGGG